MDSTWTRGAVDTKSYPALQGELEADVVIIGAGLTGVSTAYLLHKRGKKIVLISNGESTGSTSAHTTGFLTTGLDTSLSHLVQMFGADRARAIWKSSETAISLIEQTIRDEKIECEFMRCSQFTYARTESEWKEIQVEANLARTFGFEVDVRREDGVLPFKSVGYMEIKNQAKFHALKYILALKDLLAAGGVRIFDETKATDIKREGQTLIVSTAAGSIHTKDVVIATYYPFTKPWALFAHTATYMTYVFELALPTGTLPEALYQDMSNPYHYFRIDREDGHDRMIVGGEDHRRDVHVNPEKNYRALQKYVRELLPGISVAERLRWKWGVIEPLDGLPYIGALRGDQHQYVTTGLSGTGITMSRVAAEIIADSIVGEKNEWSELYRPGRIPTLYQLWIKTKDYGQEFFGGAVKNFFS
ncbi:MAG: NAD(P)/FAD-dependent oxidoreductase [Minisyncoccota bacterium]